MKIIGHTTPSPGEPEQLRICHLTEEEFRAIYRLCREMHGADYGPAFSFLDFGHDSPHLRDYDITKPIQAVYAFATAKHHVNGLRDIIESVDQQLSEPDVQ